jgi:cyclin H
MAAVTTASKTSTLYSNQRITDDDIYRNSSQFTKWSFTKDDLIEIRENIAKSSKARYNTKLEEFLSNPANTEDLTEEETEALKNEFSLGISATEQLQIVTLYTQKVQVFCAKLKLPSEVSATAMSFFKKFYISFSVLDLHPKNLIFTCIFLACKSENHFISADTFASKVKQTKESILEGEFKLLQSLKFSLMVHHVFKPLHGFYLDIQSVLSGKVDKNYLGTVYENSKKRLINSYLTDALYHFSPPHITLSSLLMEDDQLIMKYLELKFLGFDPSIPMENLNDSQKISKQMYDKLLVSINDCKQDLQKNMIPDRETAWKIDARIHYYSDPMTFIKRYRTQKTPKETETSTEPDAKKQKL